MPLGQIAELLAGPSAKLDAFSRVLTSGSSANANLERLKARTSSADPPIVAFTSIKYFCLLPSTPTHDRDPADESGLLATSVESRSTKTPRRRVDRVGFEGVGGEDVSVHRIGPRRL